MPHAAAVVPPSLGPAAFETEVARTPAGAAAAIWWQIQKHVLVGWRRPRGASELPHPRGRPRSGRPSERLRAAVPASDSARPSQRATPRGRPSERLRAADPGATPRGRPSERVCGETARPSQRATPRGRPSERLSADLPKYI